MNTIFNQERITLSSLKGKISEITVAFMGDQVKPTKHMTVATIVSEVTGIPYNQFRVYNNGFIRMATTDMKKAVSMYNGEVILF